MNIVYGAAGTSTIQKMREVKDITTVEELSAFMKSNKANVELVGNSLILNFGWGGHYRMGSQLWTRPDPTTEISVYMRTDDLNCGIDFHLPKSITVRGPVSTATIPSTLLTKESIQGSLEKSKL